MLDVLRGLNFADRAPMLSHRFGVFFLKFGIVPNPIDLRFQKVRGLSTEMQLETINEGGQNLYAHRRPNKISYNNLVLERGYIASEIPSPLNIEFNASLAFFKFHPSDVLITMFNEEGIPIGGWTFAQAYPVKWSVSDLDAASNSVAIESLELAYSRFQPISV